MTLVFFQINMQHGDPPSMALASSGPCVCQCLGYMAQAVLCNVDLHPLKLPQTHPKQPSICPQKVVIRSDILYITVKNNRQIFGEFPFMVTVLYRISF